MARKNYTAHDLELNPTTPITIAVKMGYSAYMMLHCYIGRVTDKAVQVTHPDTKITIWFPKSALLVYDMEEAVNEGKRHFTLAPWFDKSEWYYKFEHAIGRMIGN